MKPIFQKGYSRDFSLPLIEAWSKGETTDPRQWTHLMQPVKPYEIFVRENNLVDCYVDQKGIDWIKAQLRDLMKGDGYIEKVVSTYYDRASKIRKIYENEETLDRENLLTFLAWLQNCWAWHEANWFLMEVLDESKYKKFELPNKARVELQEMVPNSDVVIRKSLKSIYPKLGEVSSVLLIEEIASQTLPSENELKNRLEKYSYANEQLFTGEGLEKLKKRFDIEVESVATMNVEDFKGQVAFKGLAKGTVRKLMSRADVSKLIEGEILVSPMTMPEYVPAMKKAAAIVTDEGGITCHAAIVARELQKPCVIGTKIATLVLKDGDIVEVDASKGVIKIIKHMK